MAQNTIAQFTDMLNKRFSLGASNNRTATTSTMRETITYPKTKVTADNDACLDPSQSFGHVLACGHLIDTDLPNEPCAPNCHYVARSSKGHGSSNIRNGQGVSDKQFYCDACVETNLESRIPAHFTSTMAEERRATLRVREANELGKATKYRKCYIGAKVTSIPCHTDGTVSSKYTPRKEHHPFDTAVPQIGENVFEDVEINPVETSESPIGAGKQPYAGNGSRASEMEDGEIQEPPHVSASDRVAQRNERLVAENANDVGDSEPATSQRPRRHVRKRNYRLLLDGEDNDDTEDEDDPPVKRKRSAPVAKKTAKKRGGKR